MTALWCELAWLGGDDPEPSVLLEIEGDRIAGVERGASRGGAQRLSGITLPGLANAHSHAFQRALRGRTQSGGEGSFWTWREQMYALARELDPDSYLPLARATFAEMALAGITCVGEFHYLHHGPDGTPYDDPNAMGAAVVEAAEAAGVRLTLLDACYLRGGIECFRDAHADAWAQRASALREGPALRVGAAIHSVRAVDAASARVVAAWARARPLVAPPRVPATPRPLVVTPRVPATPRPLHAHVSEQPAENEECLAENGATPVAVLAAAGAITDTFTAVHATHLTDEDVRALGDAAATVCLCPTTERDLGDGIGPARRLRAAGARLALGSDSQAVIDLLEEARAVELDERLATRARGLHRPAELLRAATAGGYASLGWPDGGSIEPGALADLVTVSLDGVRPAGTPRQRAVDAVIFAAAAPDVRDVMVGGRWIVRDGAHVTLDVAAGLKEAIRP